MGRFSRRWRPQRRTLLVAAVVVAALAATGIYFGTPLSAVTPGGRPSVQVMSAGKVSSVAVTVGIEGQGRAQITDGLKAGQQVVLSDLNAAVPASTVGSGFAARALTRG